MDKTPRRNHLDAILAGAEVDGTFVQPKEVAALDGSNKLRIVVGDGKKHEVGKGEGKGRWMGRIGVEEKEGLGGVLDRER